MCFDSGKNVLIELLLKFFVYEICFHFGVYQLVDISCVGGVGCSYGLKRIFFKFQVFSNSII